MTVAILPFKQMQGCGSLSTDSDIAAFSQNCLFVMSFEQMLETQFNTDAHFVSYSIPQLTNWPRLKKSIIPDLKAVGMDVVLKYFSFDWDNPEHGIWTEALLNDFGYLLAGVTDSILLSWHTFYTTAHGARIIYKLSEPIQVEKAELNLAWMINLFKEKGFTRIDGACKDWTRCMRCPQVIRDKKATWESPFYYIYSQNKILDIKLLGTADSATIARTHHFDRAKHSSQPAPDHAFSLSQLQTTVNGKVIYTDFYKKARKHLKDTPYYDIIFNSAATGWEHGGRNDNVMRLIGIITPILLRKCYANVYQIYALIIGVLLTLGTDQDWPAHGWNALLDIYERENNKYNAEKEQQAEKAKIELNHLDKIVEGVKEWHNHPELFQDEESAREFVRKRSLATVGSYFFTIGNNGYYDSFPVNREQVISRINKSLFLKDIIPTTKTDLTGNEIDIPISYLQNNFSTAVSEILMKPIGDRGGFIQNMDGEKPALILSTFCRNEKLLPEFNEGVNAWLQALGGEYYDKLIDWIGNALAFEEGLICALSIEGASNAGKKLLTVGLSECLKEPFIASPLDIYNKSSAFIKTPFLVINESWPDQRGMGLSPADTFKGLLGGDGIRVEEKFKPVMTVLNPIRMILTANDDGIIRTLTKDKDMNVDNRIAIGERLFHFKVGPAEEYLREMGGMAYTACPGKRWIRPDAGNDNSDFLVAKHFIWLYKNRRPVNPKNRFLVMGNSAPNSSNNGDMNIFEKLLADNKKTPVVATAIIKMLDHKSTNMWSSGYAIDKETGRLWVTRAMVYKFVKEVEEHKATEYEIYSAMTNILAKADPDKSDAGVSWYEISVDILHRIALEWGIEHNTIKELIKIRKGKQ